MPPQPATLQLSTLAQPDHTIIRCHTKVSSPCALPSTLFLPPPPCLQVVFATHQSRNMVRKVQPTDLSSTWKHTLEQDGQVGTGAAAGACW